MFVAKSQSVHPPVVGHGLDFAVEDSCEFKIVVEPFFKSK